MAKTNEIIYDVREGIKAYTNDSEIDDRYILYLYKIKREKYLKQDLNNYQKTVDNSITQTLCVDMEEVSIDACGLDYDCGTILRSTQKIPVPIDLHTKPAITKVKPTQKLGVPFNFISKDKAVYIDSAPFSNALYAFLDPDGYIYVYSKSDSYKLLDCLTISGVFADPIALAEYKDCCNCKVSKPCFNVDESEYPLQSNYIDVIRAEIIKEFLGKLNIPEDKTNDSTD